MAFVPIGHSVQLTESYKNLKILIDAIKYFNQNWLICGDLKVKYLLSFLVNIKLSFENTLAPVGHFLERNRNIF